jgi:hypothetical protein
MAHHYIITRFSVADYSSKGFVQTRILSESAYLAQLFDSSRLDGKFQAFETMTLPSVNAQTNCNYTWLLFTSTAMPAAYKDRLQRVTSSNPRIRILPVGSFAEMNTAIKSFTEKATAYTTLRLDDDDGLAPTFLEHLTPYVVPFLSNTIVSFPRGKRFSLKDGAIQWLEAFRYPLLALGLAAVGMNIYECGSHDNLGKRFAVVYDERPDSWYCCRSEFQDTHTKSR